MDLICSVMLQRLESNTSNIVKGCSDESFLSAISTTRIPIWEIFSLSELQNSQHKTQKFLPLFVKYSRLYSKTII